MYSAESRWEAPTGGPVRFAGGDLRSSPITGELKVLRQKGEGGRGGGMDMNSNNMRYDRNGEQMRMYVHFSSSSCRRREIRPRSLRFPASKNKTRTPDFPTSHCVNNGGDIQNNEAVMR